MQNIPFPNHDTIPSDGLESLNVVFDTGEKKAEWEEAFSKAKEKLEASENTVYIFFELQQIMLRQVKQF